MDLKLHAPGHAEEVVVTDEHEIVWRVELTPCMPEESERAMERAGLAGAEEIGKLSPAAGKWAREIATKHVKRLLGAEWKGEPATVNGKPLDQVDVHELLVRHTLLTRLLALKAIDIGGAVLEQRGN